MCCSLPPSLPSAWHWYGSLLSGFRLILKSCALRVGLSKDVETRVCSPAVEISLRTSVERSEIQFQSLKFFHTSRSWPLYQDSNNKLVEFFRSSHFYSFFMVSLPLWLKPCVRISSVRVSVTVIVPKIRNNARKSFICSTNRGFILTSAVKSSFWGLKQMIFFPLCVFLCNQFIV